MELQEQAVGGRQSINIAFMFMTLILGVAGALQWPVISLFLTRATSATPMMVGAFYTANAVLGIGMSQLLARRSDTAGNRRALIVFCCIIALANALLFAFNRHFAVLITLGVLMSSISIAAMPQIFALAREYADQTGSEVVKFTTRMRVQISLSWIIAPPLAFYIIAHFGFTTLYLIIALLFAVAIVVVLSLLPSPEVAPEQPNNNEIDASVPKNRDAWWLFAAMSLLWAGDVMYLIDMPIYVSGMNNVADGFAGWLLGVGAGFEVLTVLFSAPFIQRFGKRTMFLLAALCAALFYIGMAEVHTPMALVAIQILNAMFIGIIGGVGMLYMQDLLPGAPGIASTLYTNSNATGAIIGGMSQGIVREHFGHQPVYWVAMVTALLAFGMILRVKRVQKSPRKSE